jgi:hypothetical protein
MTDTRDTGSSGYTKLLPQPDETDPAERLNAYQRFAAVGGRDDDSARRPAKATNGGGTTMPEEGLEPPTCGF